MNRLIIFLIGIMIGSTTYSQNDTKIELEVRPFSCWYCKPKNRISKLAIKNEATVYFYKNVSSDSLRLILKNLKQSSDTIFDSRVYFCFRSINHHILAEGYFDSAGRCELNGKNYVFNHEFFMFIIGRIDENDRKDFYPTIYYRK